jgi:hypothetical protein
VNKRPPFDLGFLPAETTFKLAQRRIIMGSIAARRLAKELRDLQTNGCPVGIELLEVDDKWVMGIEVLGDTLYSASVLFPSFLIPLCC